MDFLSSILNSMDKPPTFSSHQNQIIRKQKQELEKEQAKEKAKLQQFRENVERKINKFIQDETLQKYRFEPMEKVYRTIIHDVADVAGLSAFSFGDEGIDRHIMIFKKEFAPCDDELAAYRRGEEWDPEKAKQLALEKEQAKLLEIEESKKRKRDCSPALNYQEKYEKLLGRDSGKAAARIATPNKQFGFVPSDQKKDQRSIEQTLADLRAKKKLKMDSELAAKNACTTNEAPDSNT